MGHVGASFAECIRENEEAIESMKADLEANHLHKWIVFHDGEILEVHDTNRAATEAAIKELGADEPYVIHHVCTEPLPMPAVMAFRPVNVPS